MTDDNLHHLWRGSDAALAPLPLDEIKRRARRLSDVVQRRNRIEYGAAAFVVVAFALYVVILPGLWFKLGSVMVIAGVLVVVWQLARRTSRADTGAEAADVRAYYRARLVAEEHMLARVGRWYLAPLVPGFAIFQVGAAIASDLTNPLGFTALIGLPLLLFLGIWLLNRRGAAMLRDRIAQLDAATDFKGEY